MQTPAGKFLKPPLNPKEFKYINADLLCDGYDFADLIQ